jgi:hypothetical protein
MEEKMAKKNCDNCGEPLQATIIIYGDAHPGTFDVNCDTCGRPLRLCNDCWSNSDDCNECQERREKEQWCPLCDLACVNMTPEEKQQHMADHKAEECDCIVDLEYGDTIKPCALHPQGGSPKGLAIHKARKEKEGRR